MATLIEDPDILEEWRNEPMRMAAMCWPDTQFYAKQREIIYSVRDNIETYVQAGNMLGKDYVAAFITLWAFLTHFHHDPSRSWARIITTSVKDDHLDVLWAEITKFACSSKHAILHGLGGPFVMTHHEIRHSAERERGNNPINYIKGMVASPETKESFQGHHAVYSLFIVDEASGAKDWVYEMAQGWAKRFFIFGNPNQCANFFYRGCKAGDLVA